MVAIDPHNAVARNDLGAAFFQLGEIDESIPQFEAALAIDPKYPLAHINLAEALAARPNRRGPDPLPPSLGNRSKQPRGSRAGLDKLRGGDSGPPAP